MWAFEITAKHLLIIFSPKLEIENIIIGARVGYFVPLTHTGHLLINNISTSVYPDSCLHCLLFSEEDFTYWKFFYIYLD